MKVRLLKKIRKYYTYKWENNAWFIYRIGHFPIGYAKATHKAVDMMAAPMLAIGQLAKWYRKVYRLHGHWGKFHIFNK